MQEDTYRGDGLNLYVYCANNPVKYYDPSGRMLCPKWKTSPASDGGSEGGTATVDGFIKNNVNPNFQQNVKDAFYWYIPNQTSNPAADLALPQGNTYQYMDTYVIPKGITILEENLCMGLIYLTK